MHDLPVKPCPCKGSKGIYPFFQYKRDFIDNNIPHQSSANASNQRQKQAEELIGALSGILGSLYTYHSKDAKPDGIENIVDEINSCLVLKVCRLVAAHDEKEKKGDRKGKENVFLIGKRGRRNDSKQQIPEDTAANCGQDAKKDNPENISFFLDSSHRAGNCKRDGANKF